MVREGLKAMLVAEPDFTIVGDAANAEQTLEMIGHLHPDVVLLDIRLPGISGIDLCRTIASQYPQTAVLMLTTFTDESLVVQCIEAGAPGFTVQDNARFYLQHTILAVVRLAAVNDTK